MAKFKNDSLDLETGEHIDFDDADTISMGYDGAELYISSTVSGVAAVQPYHIVILSQLTDAIGGVTASGGGTYGSYYAYAKSDGVSSTNSITFVNKVSLITSTVASGTYKIEWYAELNRNSASNDVMFRTYLDETTELCNTNFRIADANSWLIVSGFDIVSFTSSATHRIDVQFAGQTTGKTSYIRRARVEITRLI
jgi:hypothetical protein